MTEEDLAIRFSNLDQMCHNCVQYHIKVDMATRKEATITLSTGEVLIFSTPEPVVDDGCLALANAEQPALELLSTIYKQMLTYVEL